MLRNKIIYTTKESMKVQNSRLIAPHGGKLCELYLADHEVLKEYLFKILALPSHILTKRQLCDLNLILNGSFSPLKGFMNRADYELVLSKMRLVNNILWPIPITLDISSSLANKLTINNDFVLRNTEGVPLAILKVSDIWIPDKQKEALKVFGTLNNRHYGVNFLLNHTKEVYVGGELIGLLPSTYYDFAHLRHTPSMLRSLFYKNNWSRVAAFQTRNPMHRAHYELTIRAAKNFEVNLLIHPVVGITKPSDIDYHTRVRCYEKLIARYPKNTTCLSLLPLAMRMGGPREALWHAIIRKNYGCSHFIIGRDHAGPGKNEQGEDFYDPYAAQDLVSQYQEELDITMIPFQEMVYVRSKNEYRSINQIKDKSDILNISGTELRRKLQVGEEIPEWFSFTEVISELKKTYLPKHMQGLTIFFTGLSGAGKSTLANGILYKLMEIDNRSTTLLDGDLIRQHLSSELGFSREHRDMNILRIGYVASEITKHRGIVICAPIAPYIQTRQKVREMVSVFGNFVEVYVNTPLNICEQRDLKGLYAQARSGLIKEFTGISDPYEIPTNPELIISTEEVNASYNINLILNYLQKQGFIKNC